MTSSNSSGRAGRKPQPSTLRSFVSFTRWSPRTMISISPRPSSGTTGKALSSTPASTPSACVTAATVVAPGVWTSSGASSPGGSVTGRASARAICTFAA